MQMSLRGSIDTMPVTELFQWLDKAKKTGVVSLELAGEEREFSVEAGDLIRAGSSNPTEFLGQMLINVGYIDQATLDNLNETKSITKTSIGKALVDTGQMDADVVETTLELKIREGFFAAMSWDEGTFVFDPSPRVAPFAEFQVRVPIGKSLQEGASRAEDWRRIRHAVPNDEVRFVVPNPLWLERAKPESPSALLLGDIQNGLAVRDIILARHSLPFPVFMHLAELIKRGIITIDFNNRGSRPGAVIGGRSARGAPIAVNERVTAPVIDLADDDKTPVPAKLPTDPERSARGKKEADRGEVAGDLSDDLEELTPTPVPAPMPEVDRPAALAEGSVAMEAKTLADKGDIKAALALVQAALAGDPDDEQLTKLHKQYERRLFAHLSKGLLGAYRVPKLLKKSDELDALTLSSGERYLVGHIDGKWDLLSIMRSAPLRPVDVLMGFQSLADRGLITLE